MRIAIFTDSFLPQINGVVTSTVSMAKQLARMGHKILIVSPKYEEKVGRLHRNIRVRQVPGMPAGFYEGFKLTPFMNPFLYRVVSRFTPDIIHFQTPITLGLEAIILGKTLRVPIVGTFHTFFSEEDYLKNVGASSSTMQRIAWSYATFFYNRADLITTPTEITRQELIRNGCNRPIQVVSNGIDIKAATAAGKQYDIKAEIGCSGPLLTYVGRVAVEKNLDFLIDTMPRVLKRYPGAKLLIVGDGPYRDEVRKRISRKRLTRSVVLYGALQHEKLIKYGIYRDSDVFVTGSKTETQGISVLEAQANGLPCIGPAAKGLVDIITDGHNGCLYTPDNRREYVEKLFRVLEDTDFCEKLQAQMLTDIQQYDIAHKGKEWVDIYNSLLQESTERQEP